MGRRFNQTCIYLFLLVLLLYKAETARDKIRISRRRTLELDAAPNLTSTLTAATNSSYAGDTQLALIHAVNITSPAVQLADLLQSATPKPIRLKLHYSGLQSSSSILSAQQVNDLQHRLGPATTEILAKFLQVRIPQSGPLTGPVQEYAQLYCEPEVLQAVAEGVNNTDMVMAVTSSPNCSSTMLGWASSCDWDPVTNRPTLGSVVVCPNFFNQTEEEQLATLLHEVTHALGFHSSWFDYWYDPQTGQPYHQVHQPADAEGEPAYLVTPRVKAYAQEFFNCSMLPGAPLDAESISHWHQRSIAFDYMVPHIIDTMQPSRVTPFTLLALEDTGWYVANLTAAEEPEHGRGAGCSFVIDSCTNYRHQDPDTNYVCAQEEEALDACTPDFRGIAYCGYGSGGCLSPVVNTVMNPDYPLLDCTQPNSFFVYNHTQEDLLKIQAVGGSVGANSRCLALWEEVCTADGAACNGYRGALCANTSCVEDGIGFKVRVIFQLMNGTTGEVNCTRGELVHLSHQLPDMFSSGKFKCPDPTVVCPTLTCSSINCSAGKGHCWEGKCRCRFMYTGEACSQSLLPPVQADSTFIEPPYTT